LINLKDWNVTRGHVDILKGVNFFAESGDVIRLVGSNGCGKSSLMQDLADKYDQACVYLPQVSNKFPKIHLQLKDICLKEFSFYQSSLMNKAWHHASGGERKKSLIARVLSSGKKIILLDEPFNDLDQKSIQDIKKIIREFALNGHIVIYIDHEVSVEGSVEVEVAQWRC
jgi:ABC-type Mn2+/Zn2+ transport system ATPase subunit